MRVLTALFGRLRYPWALLVIGAIFVADLIVPDLLPFADEVLLGLLTVLLATRRKAKTLPEGDTIDAAPTDPG